ncbi:hypothetical protein ACFXPS_04260 [Nocardia sp. NPDC059091]|uniref:hypothetical protein n=1 Tax=Nocardia sp. NPDC059091 TaxID=3346724 RepID=UPI0036B7BFE7
MRRRTGFLKMGLLMAAASAGCSTAPHAADSAPAPTPMAAPKPASAPVSAVTVSPGEVRLSPGPFTDRVRLNGIRLEGASVRGTLAIISDISDVLALEVHAAFYDTTGHVVGAGTFQHADAEPGGGAHAPNPDGIPFTITASPADAPISAAVLSIPVLVNE